MKNIEIITEKRLDYNTAYKPKIVAFIPARTTSSRLPKKHFKKIGGRTILEWIAIRLRETGCINQMVLCAPGNPSERKLLEYGQDIGFTPFYYRHGNENDVVGRLAKAANFFNAELCLLVSGDCPLISTSLIKQLVDSLCAEIQSNSKKNTASFEKFAGKMHGLQGVKLASRGIWSLANDYSVGAFEREHQFPLIDPHRQRIPGICHLILKGKACDYHAEGMDLSVNTPAQVEIHQGWHSSLNKKGLEYTYENVRDYIL